MTATYLEPRTLTFTVHSRAAPQGSKRSLGPGIMIESSKRVKPYREAVRFAALESTWDRIPFDGPVAVCCQFWFVKPKSAPKRRRTWPITRSTGDIDKLLRATYDALDDVGILHDDSIIVVSSAQKDYAEQAHVQITIQVISEESTKQLPPKSLRQPRQQPR